MADRLCPVDSTELRRIDRSGVHVDACPTCRGELDKIVERERTDLDDFEQEIRGRDAGHEHEQIGRAKPHKKKRRSMLEDFLDFG